jgi:hypothetical protein
MLFTGIFPMTPVADASMGRLDPAAKPDACDRLCCYERAGGKHTPCESLELIAVRQFCRRPIVSY